MKVIHRQFLRFLLGGGVNTVATYGLFVVLDQVMAPSMAYTVTYLAGIVLSYLINTFLVFRTGVSLRSFLQFPGVYLAQYLVGLILLNFLTDSGLDSRLAMIGVIAVNIPLTFALTRFVLRERKERAL